MVMVKKRRYKQLTSESDGRYFLKIVLYLVLGSIWLKFHQPLVFGAVSVNGFPIGLCIGMFFASRDRFQVDRKIEYALLVIATILSYFLPTGIVI